MASLPLPELDLTPATDPLPASVVLGGGCFWCTEAVFLPLDGVLGVRSGYAGGTADTANYQAVCSGTTDHAEVIEVAYDPARISLGRILQVFFAVAHDPTQLNRQGHDIGRQYRSAIFYRTPEQRRVAEAYIAQLNNAKAFGSPIVTTLEPLDGFYEAEGYHQNYAARNPGQPYILYSTVPKMAKLRDTFAPLLKSGEGS
jgi:peptide-methionine (S)-S-oxide reductase